MAHDQARMHTLAEAGATISNRELEQHYRERKGLRSIVIDLPASEWAALYERGKAGGTTGRELAALWVRERLAKGSTP